MHWTVWEIKNGQFAVFHAPCCPDISAFTFSYQQPASVSQSPQKAHFLCCPLSRALPSSRMHRKLGTRKRKDHIQEFFFYNLFNSCHEICHRYCIKRPEKINSLCFDFFFFCRPLSYTDCKPVKYNLLYIRRHVSKIIYCEHVSMLLLAGRMFANSCDT